MTPRESSLWKWLEAGKPDGCLMKRIENSLEPDMCDVLGTYKAGAFMVELKVAPVIRGGIIKIKWSSPGQILFIKNWYSAAMKTWALIQVPEFGRYLISGHYVKELGRPVTIEELRNWTAAPENAVAYQVISRMAGK